MLVFNAVIANALDRQRTPLAVSLDSLFEARYPSAKEPGASILVAVGDSVVYERQFGVADMKTKRKIDRTTTFNIASLSKQFTTIGALTLAAKGDLDIDATIDGFFPEWGSPIWQKVKVRHLMSQSSGIPDLRPRHNRHKIIFANDSVSFDYFNTLDSLKFSPGSAYDYINPTFIIIAKIMEKKTGVPFVEYQKRTIFEPLGMTSTKYFDPAGMPSHSAHAYVTDERGKWQIFEYGQETFFATRPDGGIYSCPRDLLRWESGLRENKILPAELRDEAYKCHTRVSGSPWCGYQNRPFTYYGYGFFIDRTPGFPTKVYHTGDNGGFQAYLAKYPEKNVAIIVLENRNDLDRWSMAREIDRILINNGLL